MHLFILADTHRCTDTILLLLLLDQTGQKHPSALFSTFLETQVLQSSQLYRCHARTQLWKDPLLGKKSAKKKSPGSSIRILLHFTYRLNEVICSHLNDSISVKHGASLVMENKWVPYPVKTALTTGRNLKWRQALVPLSLFSFATSACSHISIVEDGSV